MLNDPRLVKFSNEKIRVLADAVESALLGAEQAVAIYQDSGIEALIDVPADVVEDGSPADGRNPVTGQGIINYITNLQAILATFNTADEYGVTLRSKNRYLSVNPKNPF